MIFRSFEILRLHCIYLKEERNTKFYKNRTVKGFIKETRCTQSLLTHISVLNKFIPVLQRML